jgi:hypothetical protein
MAPLPLLIRVFPAGHYAPGQCSRALHFQPAQPTSSSRAWPTLAHARAGRRLPLLARRDGDRVRVFSRNAKDWTDKVPLIVEAMRVLPVMSATLDGEG